MTKADVLGIDWSVRMGRLQNVFPVTLSWVILIQLSFSLRKMLSKLRTRTLLDEMKDRDGHIFNLGHGVLPKTPPPHARKIIETIRAYHGVES